jgi:hypothetical protein
MIDFELEQLHQNADWGLVLGAYEAVHSAAKSENTDHDGWLPRVDTVAGVKAEHLPRIHGKLIALGFLKFEISGRTSGVRYRLSSLGIRAVNRNGDEPLSDDGFANADGIE